MKARRTLTFKMVLYVLLTILPVNVFLIYLAKTTQDVTRETVQVSLENIANVYMAQVERRMEIINSFVWLLGDSDRNLKAISEETDRDTYYIAAIGLRQTLNSHMLSYEDAEGYFFFSDLVESGMAPMWFRFSRTRTAFPSSARHLADTAPAYPAPTMIAS